MKQRSLKLAGVSLAAAALFGTGCDIFGGGGGGDGGTTPTTVSLAGKVLLSLTHYQYNSITNQFRVTGTEHVVVGTDGSINRLNRNDARDRALTNVLSCPNGNAILNTANNTYYFFDAQKNEIRFLAWTSAGSTVLANDKREPIGIRSLGGTGDLVAYCNGQFVAFNDNAGYIASPSWNTMVGIDITDGVIYSIKYPADLKGNFTVDSNNLMTSQPVGNGNRLATDNFGNAVYALTENWAIFPEVNSQGRLAGFIFVNLKDGSIQRKTLPNNGTVNLNAPPGYIVAVEDGNNVFMAIRPAPGTQNAQIWYGKFDGNQVSTILTIDPDPNSNTEFIRDVALDGKGNLYFIDSNAGAVLSYATPTSNQVTDLAAVANAYSQVWSGYYILPLPDGVLLAYGAGPTYVSYKAGDNNVTNINSNNNPQVGICDNGSILQGVDQVVPPFQQAPSFRWADYPVVCIQSGRGQGELAYIPSVDTNTWQVANPDGVSVNNNLQQFDNATNGLINRRGVVYGQDVFVRTNNFWYKCSLGNQVSCSRLTNVTVADMPTAFGNPGNPDFSLLPVPFQTPAGYMGVIDLLQDRVSNFVWSYPALVNPAIISGDGKKLANAYATPDSLCDIQNMANVLVTEETGNNPIDYVLFNDTDLNPEPGNPLKSFSCISNVLQTW